MSALRLSFLALLAALLWSPVATAGDADDEAEPSDESEDEAPPADVPADEPADAPAAAPAAAPEEVPAVAPAAAPAAPEAPIAPAEVDPWDASPRRSNDVPAPPVDSGTAPPSARAAPAGDVYKTTREKAEHDLLVLRAKRGVPKYLVVFVGGSSVSVFDEGLLRWQGRESVPQFGWGLDVFLHERFAVALGGTLSGERTTTLSDASDVSLSLRTGSLEAAAKAVITPPYWPVRVYGRGGAGVRMAAMGLTGGLRDDRLARRWHDGAAGYGVVGMGVELTTPRIWRDVEVPWGIGLRIEGGAELGGGGATVLAPSVDLGTAGRVDLGPLYIDVGLVLLF